MHIWQVAIVFYTTCWLMYNKCKCDFHFCNIHTQSHTHARTHIHTPNTHTHTPTHIHARTHARTRAHTHTYVCVYSLSGNYYYHYTAQRWIKCSVCERWLHCSCTDMSAQMWEKHSSDEALPFICPKCSASDSD